MKKFIIAMLVMSIIFISGCAAAEPVDLSGKWRSEPYNEVGNYMELMIEEDFMVVGMGDENGMQLYWAGDFTPMEKGGAEYTCVSTNKKDATSKSMLGSTEESKGFIFNAKNNTISFDYIGFGVTMPIEVTKQK